MAKWRTFNLEKVEMARLNWFEKVKSSHDMMTVSEEFYNFYLEQYLKLNDNDGKQKKLLISHYPLHGVSPTMNVDLFPLVAKLDNSVTSSHIPYIFNFTDDDINEINSLRSENNLNSLKEANSYGSTLKSSQAKKSKELQDIYLLNTDQFLFDQAQSMLQNLTQFFASQSQLVKTLSPELQKIVFGWKQKIENFKQKDIYLNKPMMVDGPKVSLEKIEKILGPIAYEISYYRDYYFKQLSRLPNPQPELVKNYSVFATISRSIGHPEPAMGIGEGFVAAFKANSVKGKNLNQILYPASNGAFDTKTWLEFLSGKAPVKSSVLDFLVVQMACGPDIESGQFIKDNWLAQGGRVEFVAPRLTNGDRPELCEYNYTGTNRPTTDIYRATFKVKNSKGQMVHYKGLLDYVNKNLRQDFIPYMIDDKNSEKSEKVIVQPFIQKWDQMVLPVFAQKIKDLEKDYDEVVTLLNKTIQSTNQYPLNNSRLANSPLKNIEQELVTYQTLLTHITKSLNFGTEDRVQGMNNKLATSYSFDSIRSITDPVMFKFQQDIYNSFYSVTNEVRTQLNIKNKRQTVEQMQEKINGINSVIDQAIVKISQKAKPILDPQLQAEAQKSIDEIDQQIQELKDEGASLYDDSDKGIAYLETIREMKSAYLKQNAFSTLTQVEARTLDENQYKVLVAGIILEKMKTLAGELGLYFVTINNMKLDKNLTARLSQNDTNLDCSTIDPSSMLWHNSCRLDK